MDVAVRSYLTAGVAVFGASAIALAPIQVTPPNLHFAQDRAVSALADVSLSSLTDVIQAINDGWNGVRGGLNALNGAADTAITQLGDALQAALISGIGSGNTAVQSVVDGLLNSGSALAHAIDNALAAFPDPQIFINALVQAFGNIDVNLGLALQAALNVSIQSAADLANALLAGGAALAAAFNAAVAAFPSPAAFAAALTNALAAVNPTLGILANALTTFTGQLNATLQAGIAAGLTGFQALLNALGNPASALSAAFQAALAAFPNPAAFINALVQAFGNIDVNLGLALQAALNVAIDGPQAFVDALISGGAALAAAFNAALANFPSPAAFVAALNGALAAINPTLGVLATAFTTFTGQLAATLQAGIAAGLTGFQALLNALGNPASALFAAFQAALAAFPNPQAFINALVQAFGNIDVNLGLALQAVLNAAIDGPQAFLNALISGGAALAAAFNAALANFPSPQAVRRRVRRRVGGDQPDPGHPRQRVHHVHRSVECDPSGWNCGRAHRFPGAAQRARQPGQCAVRGVPGGPGGLPEPAGVHQRTGAGVRQYRRQPRSGAAGRAQRGHRRTAGVPQRAGLRRCGTGGGVQRRTGQLPEPGGVRRCAQRCARGDQPDPRGAGQCADDVHGSAECDPSGGNCGRAHRFPGAAQRARQPGQCAVRGVPGGLDGVPEPGRRSSMRWCRRSAISTSTSGLALQAALNAGHRRPQAFLDALVSGGAALAAAFNAALANFPSPQAFVDALDRRIGGDQPDPRGAGQCAHHVHGSVECDHPGGNCGRAHRFPGAAQRARQPGQCAVRGVPGSLGGLPEPAGVHQRTGAGVRQYRRQPRVWPCRPCSTRPSTGRRRSSTR